MSQLRKWVPHFVLAYFILALGLAGFLYGMYRSDRAKLEAEVDREGREHAERVAQTLTREIEQAEIALMASSAMLPVRGQVLRPDDRFERAVRALFINNPFLFQLTLVDEDGKIPFQIHGGDLALTETGDAIMDAAMRERWQKVSTRATDKITLFGITDRREYSAVEFWKPVVGSDNRRAGFIVLRCQLTGLNRRGLQEDPVTGRLPLIVTAAENWVWGPEAHGSARNDFADLFPIEKSRRAAPAGVDWFDRQHLAWTGLQHDQSGRRLGGVSELREFIIGDLRNRFELELDNMEWRVISWMPSGMMRQKVQDFLSVRRITLLKTYLVLVLLGALVSLFYAKNVQFIRDRREEMSRERSLEMKRLDDELNMARKMIRSLLPPESGELPGFRLEAEYRPVGKVGGDYFDYLSPRPGRGVFYLFDVMGHGVPAAMNTTLARSVFRSRIQQQGEEEGPLDLTAVIRSANEGLVGNLGEDRFICALIGSVDPQARQLHLVFAGIPPILVLRRDGSVERVGLPGTPVGIVPDFSWEELRVDFAPGDRALLYTDGIVDVCNEEDEMFGDDRLRRVLQQTAGRSLPAARAEILHEMRRFCVGCEPGDDVTFILLEAV